MVFRVRIAAPKRIRAVAQEQRLEFELHRLAHALGEHEINEAFGDSDLSCRLKSEQVLAKRGEQVFGGGFGLRAILQVERIFVNRFVIGNRLCIGRARREFDAFALGEITKGL